MRIIFVHGRRLPQGYFEAEERINPDTDRVAFAWQRALALHVANWYRIS